MSASLYLARARNTLLDTKFFRGEEPFFVGIIGYANAIAALGVAMQVSILIARIIKCALRNGKRYLLPVVSCVHAWLSILANTCSYSTFNKEPLVKDTQKEDKPQPKSSYIYTLYTNVSPICVHYSEVPNCNMY